MSPERRSTQLSVDSKSAPIIPHPRATCRKYCVTEPRSPIPRKILFPAVLREDTLSGNPPFKAAFVGAPPQWGFARHGRGRRRVRGMRRRSFASEGSRERSEAPEGAARRRAHAHRMPCRLSRPLVGTSLRSCARLLRNLRGFPPKRCAFLRRIWCPSKAHSSLRPQIQSVCGRECRAGSGGGLPVFRYNGTPGMSHAKRYADRGVAIEGWDPKTGNRAATGSASAVQ